MAASLTYSVTVASGSIYPGPGTGNVYYLNGTRITNIPWCRGATLRFDLSDSSNNSHPMVFTTNLDVPNNYIITEGVVYYLDGIVTQNDWTNNTTFNAATTRYVEFTPAQNLGITTNAPYYVSYADGISYGGPVLLLTNVWSAGYWGYGNYGNQGSITVPVTSVVDSPLAWNVGNFGEATWGGQFDNIGITLGDETSAGEINEGWGRLTWGENAWGGTGDVILEGNQINISQGTVTFKIDSLPSVTGLQLNTSLGDVYAFGLAVVSPTGLQLNISEGIADASPDAIVSGEQINISSPGNVTVTVEINSGWGRLGWGIYDWGSDGLSVVTSVTGQQLNITQGDESSSANADVPVFSIVNAGWGQVAWGTQDWGQGELNINLTIAEGEVDPSPDATVTGIGMTVALAVGTVIAGDASTLVTGERLNISQGTAAGVPNTIASVTGIGLNIAVGTVFAGGTSIIDVTGNGLTIALNSINNQIWTEINTGTDATWIEIDTAA